MRLNELFNDKKESIANETATAGATVSGNIASVPNPHISPGNARGKKSYIGNPKGGISGTKAPPQPKPKMQKPTDNALDTKGSIFGTNLVKR